MTVIVWKPPYLCSDSRITEENIIFTNKHEKIVRLKDGSLLGSAGDADDADIPNLLNRLKGKLPTHKQLQSLEFEYSCILVRPDNSVYVFETIWEEDWKMYKSNVFTIKDPFVAIGSGSKWAMGALSMGASAEQAVKTAIKYDSQCGGAVQILRLESTE